MTDHLVSPSTDEPPVIDKSSESPPSNLMAALLAATMFLTRLPLTPAVPMTPALFGQSCLWFPVVGAGLGLGAGLAYGMMGGYGLPPLLAATLTVALLVGVTGALHEDGLADTADGLGGGRNRQHKLEIMHDSRIGTYGTLALVLSIAIRTSAIAALPTTWLAIKALAVAGALSRAGMVAISHWLPPARADGLSATLGSPGQKATLGAIGLALGITFLLLGLKGLLVAILAGAATFGLGRFLQAQIGGQTGDLLGGTQQVLEIVVLILMVGLR